LEAEVGREVFGAPGSVVCGALECADARSVENGTVHAAETVFHSRDERAFHLAPTLLPKLAGFGLVVVGSVGCFHGR